MASIGIGTYVLSYVWFIAVMLIWFNFRTGYSIGKLSVLGSILITIILLSLPKIDVDLPYSDPLYQKFYAARYVTVAVIVVGNIAGVAYSYFFSCLEPLQFRKIRSFGR